MARTLKRLLLRFTLGETCLGSTLFPSCAASYSRRQGKHDGADQARVLLRANFISKITDSSLS